MELSCEKEDLGHSITPKSSLALGVSAPRAFPRTVDRVAAAHQADRQCEAAALDFEEGEEDCEEDLWAATEDPEPGPKELCQNWCATIFQFGGAPVKDDVYAVLRFSPDVVRAKWSLERCPKSGRLHLQLCFRMERRVVFATARDALLFANKPSVRRCRGTWQQNLNYCSKRRTHVRGPWEYDRAVAAGSSADFSRVSEYWFGPAGNGKSTEARRVLRSEGHDIYEVCKSDASRGVWFSDYNGETGVLMEEVEADWFSPSMWKKVLDTLPQAVPSKAGGGKVDWTPRHIIMVANHPPPHFFAEEPFARRIDRIRYIDRPPYPQKRTVLEGGAYYAPPPPKRLRK